MFEHDRGYGEWVVGADEAGRGSLAGPLVAAAVCWRTDGVELPVDDSKRLTPRRRETLSREILGIGFVGWCVVPAREIDRLGIQPCNLYALATAVEAARREDAVRLVDWYPVEGAISMPKGDRTSAVIAAASIMAKVFHDRLMVDLARSYPEYGWTSNAGYGSPGHKRAIAEHGLTPEHRRGYCSRLEVPAR